MRISYKPLWRILLEKEISKKHYQKAHLLLSGKAKDYLDKRLDKLFDEYGIIDYPYDN